MGVGILVVCAWEAFFAKWGMPTGKRSMGPKPISERAIAGKELMRGSLGSPACLWSQTCSCAFKLNKLNWWEGSLPRSYLGTNNQKKREEMPCKWATQMPTILSVIF